MTRTRTTLVAGGVALLVLTGCGGGKKEASPPATTAAGGPTTTVGAVGPTFTGQGSTEFCNLARTYVDRSATVGSASLTPAQLRSRADEGQTAIKQAVDVAPPEIKSDVQLIATTFAGLLAELDKVNYHATELTPAAFAPLQAPDFARASQRFQAYTRDVCKLS